MKLVHLETGLKETCLSKPVFLESGSFASVAMAIFAFSMLIPQINIIQIYGIARINSISQTGSSRNWFERNLFIKTGFSGKRFICADCRGHIYFQYAHSANQHYSKLWESQNKFF